MKKFRLLEQLWPFVLLLKRYSAPRLVNWLDVVKPLFIYCDYAATLPPNLLPKLNCRHVAVAGGAHIDVFTFAG